MAEPMTTEQLLERLRALAEARAAGVVDETARIRFENACINTNFPALLEAVEGLVRERDNWKQASVTAAIGLEVLVASDAEQPIADISPSLRNYLRGGLAAIRCMVSSATSQTPGAAGE